MNKLQLITLIILLLFSCKLFGQNSKLSKEDLLAEAELRKLEPLMKMGDLVNQLKIKEALPILTKYIDSLKVEAKNKPELKNRYITLQGAMAPLYIELGEFSKAEQLLRETLPYQPPGKDTRRFLNLLSILYEKMGNEEAAENILEKLIFSEYGNSPPVSKSTQASKKERFFSYYRNMYPALANKKTSDSEIDKAIEEQWNLYLKQQTQPDTGEQAAGMRMMNAMMELQLGNQPKQPKKDQVATDEQLQNLRNGTLALGGNRDGIDINKPWEELKRLFNIYKNSNNYAGAEALIKQAIAIDDTHSEDDGNAAGTLITEMFSPQVSQQLEKYGLSKNMITSVEQVNTSAKKYGGTDVFYIQNKVLLAQLYKDNDKQTEYELLRDTIYQLCKKLDEVANPFIVAPLAEAYTQIAKYDEAKAAYKKIIKYHNTSSVANPVTWAAYLAALQQLSKLYQLTGDYPNAKATLKLALQYDQEIAAEKYPAHMERVINLAQLYESTGQLDIAEQYCGSVLLPVMNTVRDNFSFLSESEKIAFTNTQVSAFDFSASLLFSDPKPQNDFVAGVYAQQLQLKGLVLNDAEKTFNQIRKSSNMQLKKLLDSWTDNREAIARQYSQQITPRSKHIIDSLKIIANDQEKQLNQLSVLYNTSLQNQQIGFTQIQNHLNINEAAVEFVRFRYYHKQWTDSTFYGAFVITRGNPTPQFIPLCEEKKLAMLLESNRSSYKDFIDTLYGNGINPDENSIPGRKSDQLYKLIWQPVEKALNKANVKNIAISPAGLLSRVSFSALPFNSNEYLADKYEIRQYSSLKKIAAQKTSVAYKTSTDAVIFGDIDYGPPNDIRYWPALNTANNINAIANQFKLNHIPATMLTGADANEDKMKKLSGHSPRLLYIITHGFSKPQDIKKDVTTEKKNPFTTADDPMLRSGIILANANPVWGGQAPAQGSEDGIVTAYEIANLDLSNTELVLLGACETALGDIKSTEGVFGLQRAFKLAGVQNMLLGLWDLHLDETNQLISGFNKNKINTGMTTYQAFKTVQSDLRKKYPPYIWAGMVLIE